MTDTSWPIFVSNTPDQVAEWTELKARVCEFIGNDDATFDQLRMSEVHRRHLFRIARKLAKLAVTLDDEGWRQSDEKRAAAPPLKLVTDSED